MMEGDRKVREYRCPCIVLGYLPFTFWLSFDEFGTGTEL